MVESGGVVKPGEHLQVVEEEKRKFGSDLVNTHAPERQLQARTRDRVSEQAQER